MAPPPPVEEERVEEIEKKPETVTTLPEMMEAPCDFRLLVADQQDRDIRVEFLLTQRVANVNRIMRKKGLPCMAIGEFAAYIKASDEARLAGYPGMTISALRDMLRMRYAGRELDMFPSQIYYEPEKACSSSSTSSDDAKSDEADASTSTKTSPSTPAEPVSETPA